MVKPSTVHPNDGKDPIDKQKEDLKKDGSCVVVVTAGPPSKQVAVKSGWCCNWKFILLTVGILCILIAAAVATYILMASDGDDNSWDSSSSSNESGEYGGHHGDHDSDSDSDEHRGHGDHDSGEHRPRPSRIPDHHGPESEPDHSTPEPDHGRPDHGRPDHGRPETDGDGWPEPEGGGWPEPEGGGWPEPEGGGWPDGSWPYNLPTRRPDGFPWDFAWPFPERDGFGGK